MNDFSGGACVAGVEQCLRERDWSDSPLGAPSGWPPALAHAARFMCAAATPMFLGWGEALGVLYNDASVPMLGARHPAMFGRGLRDWPALGSCASSIVMWHVRLRIWLTRPRARGRQRFSVGPSSA